jgi:hypothetical protein
MVTLHNLSHLKEYIPIFYTVIIIYVFLSMKYSDRRLL